MIIEQQILPFSQWIGPAAAIWGGAFLALMIVAVFVGFVISALKFGLASSFGRCASGFSRALEDFFHLSASRTWAIARLSIKEALKRRVLILCVVFLVILMLAGWYLDPNSQDPARVYLSFVSTATCYLMLLLALFLSAFSLPTDFKTKTIYTVVTKPVRASEMVLGRILGITLVGSMLLLFMSVLSYFFVQMSLSHSHILTQREDLTEVSILTGTGADRGMRVIFSGETRQSNGHKHPVEILEDRDGNRFGHVGIVNGHEHAMEIEETPEGYRYSLSPAQGNVQARVPVYGELTFRGKDGIDARAGINVGDEWMYRSFIGGTGGSIYSTENKNQEAAFWTINGVTKNRFPEGIPVEMTLGVFRTHKGDMEQRITANLGLRNPTTGLFVDALTFSTEEFITKSVLLEEDIEGPYTEIIQRRVRDPNTGAMIITPSDEDLGKYESLANKKQYNIFEDLVDENGRLEIWLSCGDSQQYIGVAQYDLYLRAGDANVPFNFVKGFFGIWLQMLLLISYGVVLSTFLSGPVTMVSTMGVMIAGFYKSYLINIGLTRELGGGPVEAFVRILTQQNLVQDLPAGFATSFIKAADKVFGTFLALFGYAIPPLSDFEIYSKALASGFDIPVGWIVQNSLMTCSYVFPLFIIGYLILSNREVAK